MDECVDDEKRCKNHVLGQMIEAENECTYFLIVSTVRLWLLLISLSRSRCAIILVIVLRLATSPLIPVRPLQDVSCIAVRGGAVDAEAMTNVVGAIE